jgi:predicted lysophospholipase L1 biosynthesis ABC-type transport system permease subunit
VQPGDDPRAQPAHLRPQLRRDLRAGIAAIVIGLIGIAATFSAQAIARTREFGMLRHIGVTRGQILGLLAIEGCWSPLLAIVLGLATGLAVALGAGQDRQPAVVPLDHGLSPALGCSSSG